MRDRISLTNINLYEEDRSFERLLKHIEYQSGIKCEYYRREYLIRRIRARMDLHKLQTYDEYIKLLRKDPDEYSALLDCIGVNVTEFFRDVSVYEELAKNVMPEIINWSQTHNNRSIRIWSTSCATGEEPYSIAIILKEILKERFELFKIKIFATDIDTSSLQNAKKGLYSKSRMLSISKDIIENYFKEYDYDTYKINDDIKKMVIFKKYDLISGPPFCGMDLILCRNILIYINFELQLPLFNKFYASLRPGGYLVLGKTETLNPECADKFITVNLSEKIYKRKDIYE